MMKYFLTIIITIFLTACSNSPTGLESYEKIHDTVASSDSNGDFIGTWIDSTDKLVLSRDRTWNNNSYKGEFDPTSSCILEFKHIRVLINVNK